MDEIKLSDDLIEQIKDFTYWSLTKEQKSLIDKLITDKELKERYKKYGLCGNCKQPYTNYEWCQPCISNYFQQNFKNWTSGNHDVDEFIQKAQLKASSEYKIIEWIEYDKFEDVEYLAKGGFGTVFKAVWKDGPIDYWDYKNHQFIRKRETKVALKCLYNSQDIAAEFLKEVESHILVRGNSNWLIQCFDWEKKLFDLQGIAYGLIKIHNEGLIHHDFHCGNILSNFNDEAYITDLGLCQPANVKSSQNTQNNNKKIYGVLPYVAPEVLRGNEYTQKSDIYGFGIIAYEICTGFPPYHDIAHDEFLAMKICQGLRPKSNYKIPQLIVDIINQCWDADPLKRPDANELPKLILKLLNDIRDNKVDSVIYGQVEEADEVNKKSSSTVQLPLSSTKPKNANNDDLEYSDSLRMDFTKLDIIFKDKRN
ncbi:unnamed protein product [Rhizophagus irregularis]|nr:unnamed protein product [Rhizophagus irregularis]